MEISPRQSLSLDFDASALSTANSSYTSTYINRGKTIYDAMPGNSAGHQKIVERFAMSGSPIVDPTSKKNVLPARKQNFMSQVFNALTSGVMERLAKLPTPFVANMNGALSVTVVPNEGIISSEFFKTLTQSCEQLVSEIDNERIVEPNFFDTKSHVSQNFSMNSITEKTSTDTILDRRENETNVETTMRRSEKNCDGIFSTTNETTNVSFVRGNEDDDSSVDWTKSNGRVRKPRVSKSKTVERETENDGTDDSPAPQWQNLWSNVRDETADRTISRNSSPEPEVPVKKPNLAQNSHPKPRRRTCIVARSRGKGRGKSQLRKSGVSQSSLRKERTKQNIYSDIQEDLEDWEDLEFDDTPIDDSSRRVRNDGKKITAREIDWNGCATISRNFTFEESTKTRRPSKFRETVGAIVDRANGVEFAKESTMEIDERNVVGVDESDCATRIVDGRPRLVSESSVDSEDSYCIVFENDSNSDCTDYTCDTDTDEDFDSEDDEDDKTTMRVRFNLEPRVHRMIQWNFAYRAARRGPWEEMARDRERFKGRIHGIERILSSVLSPEHRKSVFHQRFDVDG